MRNCYFKSSKLNARVFHQICRFFALNLTASHSARLTGVSVRSGNDLDRVRIGYDRSGNPLWEQNVLEGGHSELFTYDGLDRLATWERGSSTQPRTGS